LFVFQSHCAALGSWSKVHDNDALNSAKFA
jgi:hypothetical protein